MRREANKQIILQANYAGDGESDVWTTAGLMMVMVIKIMILMMIVMNKC